jgi:hypothetical protein
VYLCDAEDHRRLLGAALEARAWALLDAERIVEEEVARWRRDDEVRRAARPDWLERAAREAADAPALAVTRTLAPAPGGRARPTGAA